ncbi:MAG: glutathione S-transferase [Brevirhabdus sp.]
MKLLWSPPSPFARKPRVVLHETGQLDDVEQVEVVANPMTPNAELIAQNPVGKIPALVRRDGPTLYDSRVVCRYLDACSGGALYPQDRIWEVLTLEATGDAIMDSAVSMVYEKRLRPEHLQSHDWIEAQWTKVSNALDALEARWLSHLSGPLDAGQIAVGCALGYLDFRHADRSWRQGRAGLDDWFAAFSARESMVKTAPPTGG